MPNNTELLPHHHEPLPRRQQGRPTFDQAWRGVREAAKTKENNTERIILPKVSIPADTDSIQNQEIAVVDEGRRVAITFKLNPHKWQALVDKLRNDSGTTKTQIVYGGDQAISFCPALMHRVGDFRIFLAETEASGNDKRASYGLVRIELGKETEGVKTEGDSNVEKKITKTGDLSFPTLGEWVKKMKE
ncbi:MAG: hypothetical protein HY225_00565, partial [Candidatus Vogelbacteria bacterium]|nr:hypothetical protein [Candidatus Vogelbacteria bacterium]